RERPRGRLDALRSGEAVRCRQARRRGSEHGEAAGRGCVVGGGQRLPPDAWRLRVRGGVRCRAQVQRDAALSGGAHFDESDPVLHRRARARYAKVILTMTPDPMTRLSRSLLFVPASTPAMIQKAAASAADLVCIDLEDAVAPDEKAASRPNVVRALKELNFGRRT